MKKLLIFSFISLLSYTSTSQSKDLFFIKMDKKMQFKTAKNNEILYLSIQHKRFKVKHVYLFKVDRKNVFQVKDKKGKIIEIVGITKKDIYTRGELRRIKPPILDQILKNKKHLLLMHFQNFDIQHYWTLKYLGSTVER